MAAAPIMNGATSANGHEPEAATTSGAQQVAVAAANLMNATVDGGRKLMAAGGDEQRVPLSHTSMKAWLIRSVFMLFAATMMVSLVLLGLGLMGASEVAMILMPIATMAAAMFGFYFGDSDTN